METADTLTRVSKVEYPGFEDARREIDLENVVVPTVLKKLATKENGGG